MGQKLLTATTHDSLCPPSAFAIEYHQKQSAFSFMFLKSSDYKVQHTDIEADVRHLYSYVFWLNRLITYKPRNLKLRYYLRFRQGVSPILCILIKSFVSPAISISYPEKVSDIFCAYKINGLKSPLFLFIVSQLYKINELIICFTNKRSYSFLSVLLPLA